jgi:UDPglucose 6-dehydrogenase
VGRIGVIGTGYVGLTTGVCFAHLGHDVVCADIDAGKIARLQRGEATIVETGLENLLSEGVRSGRLRFVAGTAAAAVDREFVYLCVPTPPAPDGSADLTYIEGAAAAIASVLQPEAIVVNKSTVPVGSTKVVGRVLRRPDVSVVSNPEFLREGSAIHDFLHPDRIVIGSDDQAAAIKVASLYLGIAAPLVVTDPASAETIKYASNAFLATKLSFVNAVAAVCEAVGADVNDVMLGLGYDRRIGQDFLKPGPGWGGTSFPKDTRALVKIAADAGYDFELLTGVIAENEEQRRRVVAKIRAAAGGDLDGQIVAIWGLTFKARTDDRRESPSLAVASELVAGGAKVRAYDPTVTSPLAGIDVEICTDPFEACDGAVVLAVLTEWDEFRWLDLERVGAAMAERAIVDARNLLDRSAAKRAGFSYTSIGRA